MTKTYEIKITLVTIGVNPKDGQYSIVSLEPDSLVLPFQIFDDTCGAKLCLDNITNQYVDLDPGWITYKIVDWITDNTTLVIIYVCQIPLDTILKNAHWIPLWKCTNNPITLKVVSVL